MLRKWLGLPNVVLPFRLNFFIKLDEKLLIVNPFLYISFDGWTKDRNYACNVNNIEYCDEIHF